jgi:hypothetical protein
MGKNKPRWIHYAQTGFDIQIRYACGKDVHHDFASWSQDIRCVNCPNCLEVMRQNNKVPIWK